MYDKVIKRVFDSIFAPIMIIILSPLYITISFMILLNMGKPIIFKQERVGKDNKKFYMYKFRSMKESKSAIGNIEDDHKRLTKLGMFLRSTSLDELPELFNIVKGDMSFIGPRPFPSYYLPYYSEKELERHSVRGGLIPCDGLSGKSDLSWEEQFEIELQYVKHIGLWLDIMIVLRTMKILFVRIKENYGKVKRPLLNEYRKTPRNNKYGI